MARQAFKKINPTSFLSCESDMEKIIHKLFVDYGDYSRKLKALLAINNPDCLEKYNTDENYKKVIEGLSVKKLKDEGYIKITPKLMLEENAQIKSRIFISFDNFTPNKHNPQYRDYIIHFDVICHTDTWDIGDYRLRPLKIIGYIDGMLNNSKDFGIGSLQFLGCNELVLDENFSGYCIMYSVTRDLEEDRADDSQ